jgi:hypothetical protein
VLHCEDRPSLEAGLFNFTGASSCEGWLYRNDRVVVATLLEDLTLIPGPEWLRRFLATPLHEIILLKEVVHRPT